MNLLRQFDDFFLNWPSEPKPPIVTFPLVQTDKKPVCIMGWQIQMALSGFRESDVQVWYENQILHISGNNTKRGYTEDPGKVFNDTLVHRKFTSNFHHRISCTSDLDLSATQVSLKDGMLNVFIPIDKKTSDKTYLFGDQE